MAPKNPSLDVCDLEADDLLPDMETTITSATPSQKKQPPRKIIWTNVFWILLLHVGALYGLYLLPSAHALTWVWTVFTYVLGGWGITAGVHRLWSHRSYRAKLPLRIFLAICNTMSYQNDIIEWCRDHRAHHKFSETDGDPHNAMRGFFFSHCGWLMMKKHPDVKNKGKTLDCSDLYADPVCVYQRKVYYPAVVMMTIVVPAVVPVYFWQESLLNGFFISAILKYVVLLNATWCVNSVAHMFGNKPYDRFINPAESPFVSFAAIGEGFHNYHHTFPADYSTSELGWKLNLTTLFIDFMALIGQVEHRKKMSEKLVSARKQRTGDGTEGFGFGQMKLD